MILAAAYLFSGRAHAEEQEHSECPMHAAHQSARDAHGQHVDARHDQVTGVSHAAAVHHFLLFADGGRIVLEAADESDNEARDRIRGHLQHVAEEFAQGRFDLPMLIHERVPPGVDALQRLRTAVRYEYAPTAHGGAVDITATGPEVLEALHAFLRFQIQDHGTGDSEEVSARH